MINILTISPSDKWWYTNWMPESKWKVWLNKEVDVWVIPNQDKVFEQHKNLIKQITSINVANLINIPFSDIWKFDISDNMVFVRDSFLSDQKSKIFMSKFRNPSRLNQADIVKSILENKIINNEISREFNLPPLDDENIYLEWGDFRYLPEDNLLFVWYNPDKKTSRNSEEWIKWLIKEMNLKNNNFINIHSKWYHIDTVLWLATNIDWNLISCITNPEKIGNYEELKTFCEKKWIKLLNTFDKNNTWVFNTLNLNEYLLSSDKFDKKTEEELNKLWVKRVIIDTSEYWKAWWWIHCLTNQI